MPGVSLIHKSAARSFNPFAPSNTKPTDIKKAHSFLTFTWTRALCKSVSQKMFGKKLENLPKLGAEEQRVSSSQRFVNEVIIATRPFDLILWCPVISSIMDLFSVTASSRGEQRQLAEQGPARMRRKISPSSISLKSASESQHTRASSHKKVRQDTEWLTNQALPLIYVDCKDFRIFVPAKCPDVTEHAGESGDHERSDAETYEGDTFVMQVNSVVLSPHADNPLQRLIVKKDFYR